MSTINPIQPGLDPARLNAFASRFYAEPPNRIRLKLRPLPGGLEARAVVRVEVVFVGSARPSAFFAAKCVPGEGCREIAAYEMLSQAGIDVMPRLLGSDYGEAHTTYLYLEWVDPCCSWPWDDPARIGSVLRQIAHIHNTGPVALPRPLMDWSYETELQLSANSTVEAFANAAGCEELSAVRWRRRSLERIVDSLPAIRRRLMAKTVLLHGDVHSGNVVFCNRGNSSQAVLLDWNRIRIGSPLEDVSSWLQSLGYWEWQARRGHDTLLRLYLEARGLPSVLTNEVRELYWLAGACNALAGALRYHLSFVNDGWPGHVRAKHAKAACDWLRIIRRAHSCWHF
jgi:hypothetical protein